MKEKLMKLLNNHYLYGFIILIVFMGTAIILSSNIDKSKIKPDNHMVYSKATITKIIKDNSGNKEFGGPQKVMAKITSGKYKGKTCELSNPNSYKQGAFCKKGTKVIAVLGMDKDGVLAGGVHNYDRTNFVIALVVLFLIAICAIGRKKGLTATIALIFTALTVVFIYIPLIYKGMNSVIAAIITSVIILCASIYLISGKSLKTLCSISGTVIGVTLAGIIALIFGNLSHLSGFNTADIEKLIYIASHTNLSIKELLFSGILISSLGAVMDVSMSITSSMQEINFKAPDLSSSDLFKSGMRIGSDIIGTMSNTLILAYTGTAIATLLTVYSYEMSFYQTMGTNDIIISIISSICATFGVILTVPVQVLICTYFYKHKASIKNKK